jgi:hypothetical protein
VDNEGLCETSAIFGRGLDTDRTDNDCELASPTGSNGEAGVICGLGGKGFLRAVTVTVSTCSESISADGCLFNDDGGETGVGSAARG